jgi:hypothetical protein
LNAKTILRMTKKPVTVGMNEDQCYITIDARWIVRICPLCKSRDASAHGWLFEEPPPAYPLQDKRKSIGEVFIHDSGDDCETGASTENR